MDEFYHQLRELNLSDDIFEKAAIAGIVSHLTGRDGDYVGLLRFLTYYGEKYVLPDAVKFLRQNSHLLEFNRVVDIGAGLGWLGRGIANGLNTSLPTLYVDKRQWAMIDVVADIEAKNGIKRVLDELKEGDLIVMSEVLHCLNDPEKVMKPFKKWPILAIEYDSVYAVYRSSYRKQIENFDCNLVDGIHDVFKGCSISSQPTEPYMMWLILPQ